MIPELVSSLEFTLAFMRQQVADLSEEEMVLQPPGAPNHAAWTLGHVIYSCQAMAIELGMETWLPSEWEGDFAYGSVPSPARTERSSKQTLLAALAEASDRLRTVLLEVDESSFGKPLPYEETRETLPTVGHALTQVLVAHTAFHAGQLAAWRRAIGRAPVAVFV